MFHTNKIDFIKFSFLIISTFFLLSYSCLAEGIATAEVTFLDHDNKISFKVEIADTADKMQKGLMFKENLPESEGMLFILKRQTIPYMWMKNTLIPLDMIFIDDNQKVIYVASNTVPLSEKIISPLKPCSYVLEINAGLAEKYNIQTGEKISIKVTTQN